jgi:cellobiose-specific phosphotransferase system component IIA
MLTSAKKKMAKELTAEQKSQLEVFMKKVEKGEIEPFEEKIENARKNLKKAGLIG